MNDVDLTHPWRTQKGVVMSEALARAQAYHAAIRKILLNEWDPIGVSTCPEAQDEYDSYVGEIYVYLIRREPKYKLFDYMWAIENKHMGLCGNRTRTEMVVNMLLDIPNQL